MHFSFCNDFNITIANKKTERNNYDDFLKTIAFDLFISFKLIKLKVLYYYFYLIKFSGSTKIVAFEFIFLIFELEQLHLVYVSFLVFIYQIQLIIIKLLIIVAKL